MSSTSDAALTPAEREKKAAAEASVEFVENGMMVGLGTGSTVAFLLPALARRGLSIRCVATSPRTDKAGRELGLAMEPFGGVERFDIAIDGADEVAPDGWLIKGGGAAHTREKIIAAAADRFVVIADSSKVVPALSWPVPIELLEFGLASTLRRLPTAVLRDVPRSPDNGVIADYHGSLVDPEATAAMLSGTAGLVEHGLFPPSMVSDVLIARGTDIEHRVIAHP